MQAPLQRTKHDGIFGSDQWLVHVDVSSGRERGKGVDLNRRIVKIVIELFLMVSVVFNLLPFLSSAATENPDIH
jgi:hypothetical protein